MTFEICEVNFFKQWQDVDAAPSQLTPATGLGPGRGQSQGGDALAIALAASEETPRRVIVMPSSWSSWIRMEQPSGAGLKPTDHCLD